AVARPRRLEDARPDDAAGAHHAHFRGEQVHAAAAAVRAAGLPAEQLGKKLPWRDAFRQRMPVAAVRAEDHVVLPQVSADADVNRFLADIRVAGPVDQPALVRPGELLLAA